MGERGEREDVNTRAAIFFYTNRHDLFVITVQYYDNIPNGIQVMEQT